MIEPLEARIAPAILVNPTTVTYTDLDGDAVTVKSSVGTFILTNPNGGGADSFKFVDVAGGQQLKQIYLADADFIGANITVSVIQKANGDGLANVGEILSGRDLGAVSIKGDLGAISCGDDTETATGFGLKSLSVQSLGRFGAATGAVGNGDNTLESHIFGALGKLVVKGDLENSWLHVTGKAVGDEVHGTIGSITIGGSVIGGSVLRAGAIESSGDIGVVSIGHDIQGGTADAAGFVQSDSGKIKSVTLGGSLIGGSKTFTGQIRSGSDLGPVKIAGNVQGGSGATSGFIATTTGFGPDFGKIASITIGGSLLGGAGADSGEIRSSADLGPVKIGHDIRGGDGLQSGYIESSGGNLASVIIGGSLIGGSNSTSGQIYSGADMGAVKIGHDVLGGSGVHSGSISAGNNLAGVSIGGSVIGGSNNRSGEISSTADMGAVKIGHDVQGGSGGSSGYFNAGGKLASVTLGGSLIGGSGSGINHSGVILSAGDMGAVKIGRDLIGGSITGSASLDSSGFITSDSGRIASVTLGGSIISGIDTSTGTLSNSAAIRAFNDIGSLTVKGSLIGHGDTGTGASPVIISARGQDPTSPTLTATSDMAIGKITIGGHAEFARILGGYGSNSLLPQPLNGNAQIGSVKIGGDWVGSDLIAGVQDGGAAGFGDAGDTIIGGGASIAKIASIVIGDQVIGTSGSDHFGFVSHTIGSFKAAGFTAVLNAAALPKDVIPLSLITADVTVREI